MKESRKLGALRYVRILMPAGDWVANGNTVFFPAMITQPALEWVPPASDLSEAAYKEYVRFVNYYIHQVNLMRYLLGEPYQVTYADPSGIMFAGRSESGVACVLEMSPYTTSLDWQEPALAAFERGYVKIELPAYWRVPAGEWNCIVTPKAANPRRSSRSFRGFTRCANRR